MPNFVLGMDGKLYRAAAALEAADAAAAAGATWTVIDTVQDVTINLETGEADITTRANNGWRQTAATLKELTLEFKMIWKPGDAGFEAIRDAWLNSTEIGLAAMDGDITTDGNQGPVSNFSITNFSREEPLEEAMVVNVTAKSSSFTQWYEKAAA